MEFQIESDGALTIIGLVYEATANTYLQASTYNYYVGISDPDTPASLKHIKVRVFDVPELSTTRPSALCDPNGSVDLSNSIVGFDTETFDYQVLDPLGRPILIDEIYYQTESGVYLVKSSYKDFNCWSEIKGIDVTIAEEILETSFNYEMDLGNGGDMLVNDTIQVFQQINFIDMSEWDGIAWHWDFGDGSISNLKNPQHTYAKKGNYTVVFSVTNSIGCIYSYERTVVVRDDYRIIFPNAFTPSKAKNRYFRPYYIGFSSIEFYVFNTWGELIFEDNSLETQGWDGSWLGKESPNGSYVYKAIFYTSSGRRIEKSGLFLLIK
ncbi:hypothetical protein J2X69_000724 [Algoriphagus sp. 4150]|uniref:PKD domain-containing protein n=1 Tax=Algoriphagus sp. 4150 TaxID=2817756 RepID=UPI002856CEBC|nr:PKD domain-containing protein [Algoriphagus sp. 4150]MDR7128392.1 hypothetical protein [Algoriphagus sp. 4150]